eukprot:3534433-Rhodomonas_salina.1
MALILRWARVQSGGCVRGRAGGGAVVDGSPPPPPPPRLDPRPLRPCPRSILCPSSSCCATLLTRARPALSHGADAARRTRGSSRRTTSPSAAPASGSATPWPRSGPSLLVATPGPASCVSSRGRVLATVRRAVCAGPRLRHVSRDFSAGR